MKISSGLLLFYVGCFLFVLNLPLSSQQQQECAVECRELCAQLPPLPSSEDLEIIRNTASQLKGMCPNSGCQNAASIFANNPVFSDSVTKAYKTLCTNCMSACAPQLNKKTTMQTKVPKRENKS